MRCLALVCVLLTPALAQWTVIADIPAILYDREAPPSIAAGPDGDVYAGSSNHVLRIDKQGKILWDRQVPFDFVSGLAIGPDGGAFVAGRTGIEGFITRLDPQGALLATYPITGKPSAVTMDAAGALYITGTAQEGFVTTPGAYKTVFGQQNCEPSSRTTIPVPCTDAFAMKMNSSGAIEWATLLGGSWPERGLAIAIDTSGNVWIAGETVSDDYPTSSNALQRNFHGRFSLGYWYGDGFLTQLDSAGRRLLYSTFLGGDGVDYATALTTAGDGVVVTGVTQLKDFPVSPDAFQPQFSGGLDAMPLATANAFVAHFSGSGQRVYATYFGAKAKRDFGASAAVDGDGRVGIALAGRTGSCVLRYDPHTLKLSEDCYKLVTNDPFGIAFGNGMWVAAGSTHSGNGVPGVDVSPRLCVTPLAGIGDNSGPAVVGLWNEYRPDSRPMFTAGSIVSIYGPGIGRSGAANTSVLLDDRTLTVLYAGGDQINALVPADLPTGFHSLTVAVPFFGTVPVAVDVVERWPGLYPGALNEDGTINSETNPARLGSIVSLFASGFGPEPLPVMEAYITGDAIGMKMLYAGRAPGAVDGIYQVNARIPPNAQTGRVPVRLVLGPGNGFFVTPLTYIWIR